jgi:hypothetical protein
MRRSRTKASKILKTRITSARAMDSLSRACWTEKSPSDGGSGQCFCCFSIFRACAAANWYVSRASSSLSRQRSSRSWQDRYGDGCICYRREVTPLEGRRNKNSVRRLSDRWTTTWNTLSFRTLSISGRKGVSRLQLISTSRPQAGLHRFEPSELSNTHYTPLESKGE